MPTTFVPSTTGNPEILCKRVSAKTSRTVMCGWMVTGSLTTPDSKRLTRETWIACISAVMFLWIMPMPPSCASAMASGASVTVSIAADTTGMLRRIVRVNCVARLTSRGSTLECAGTNKTSSNVSAFCNKRMVNIPCFQNKIIPTCRTPDNQETCFVRRYRLIEWG